MTGALLPVALDLIRRGWAPLPIPYQTKRPRIEKWPELRISADKAGLYFDQPTQNIGVLLGQASGGLTDVDLDCSEAADLAPFFLPETGATFGRAGRRRSHYLYMTALSTETDAKAIEFHDPTRGREAGSMLVEIRIGGGDKGAQTIMPGSTHVSGEPITWDKDGGAARLDSATLKTAVGRLAAAALLARHWNVEGRRHNAAVVLGGLLARLEWPDHEAETFIEAVVEEAGDEEVDDRKRAVMDAIATRRGGGKVTGYPKLKSTFGEPIAKAVVDWLGYDARKEKNEGATTDGRNTPLPTEDSAATMFADQYRGALRFCHSHGSWFQWTGTLWAQNRTGLAFHYARELARELGRMDKEAEATTGRAAFAGAVERFARTDPTFAVQAEAWDRNPLLLGTPGGTVDLETGELRPAKPTDGITKSTAVAPAPTPACPTWLRFLEQATGGDAEMVQFLRAWFGYCLTGLTREHALVFVHGPGGNGKSVFVNVITGILGTYATTAAMQTFTASTGAGHPTDIAMLKGARLVSASETEEGAQWAEARIKSLTGGDTVSARFMRQDFFSFVPAFKLLFVGNHRPGLRNVDDAARRRFNLIPFIHKPDRPDRHLEDKLKAEWPGILRWAIEGCLLWQVAGLPRPASLTAATADYFDAQDVFGAWLAEECEVAPGDQRRTATSAELFLSWQHHAKIAGEPAGTKRSFAEQLIRRGLEPHKGAKGARVYVGIRLRASAAFDHNNIASVA
ncbi:phage/plasmid primase, P4 family [Lichenibacterium ramalinae]|uniref:SF3 helicase domain-containing protein n=1 Tax=Lichenibacterium ramalinae TaxID=2316527 RepID=A0A4Q2RHX5_9HYPH|nr:phage/plasmid primase, P4 family [Lichenibacterium ramalinae]RYB05718.1 hypothetical protein D3272_09040 [Lichenibacterium ramalinae]